MARWIPAYAGMTKMHLSRVSLRGALNNGW